MLRQNRHRHVIQKCNVGSREAEGDGIVVFHRDFLHVLEVRRILRAVVGVHDGLNRELHVVAVSTRRRAGDVRSADGSVGVGFLVKIPAFGEARNDVVFAVVGGEAVEDEEVDFSVLVHRGIDAGVIARAVDQRRGLGIICRGFLRGSRLLCGSAGCFAGGFGLCAGAERKQHGQRQKKREKLFHGSSPEIK